MIDVVGNVRLERRQVAQRLNRAGNGVGRPDGSLAEYPCQVVPTAAPRVQMPPAPCDRLDNAWRPLEHRARRTKRAARPVRRRRGRRWKRSHAFSCLPVESEFDAGSIKFLSGHDDHAVPLPSKGIGISDIKPKGKSLILKEKQDDRSTSAQPGKLDVLGRDHFHSGVPGYLSSSGGDVSRSADHCESQAVAGSPIAVINIAISSSNSRCRFTRQHSRQQLSCFRLIFAGVRLLLVPRHPGGRVTQHGRIPPAG